LHSYQNAINSLTAESGQIGSSWQWGRTRGTNIMHLGRIPGLGRMNLATNGNYATINATTEAHGPTWRMVVEMEEAPVGWGIYPGGQSGNPGSRFYDNFTDDWLAGKYYELLYLRSAGDKHPRLVGITLWRGKQ
ncbi:MAG: penicillin acylase family protein, partial [Planctomycetes bacterium]|nr:penicillin acylase family protein [Planctomycetota bacterium]